MTPSSCPRGRDSWWGSLTKCCRALSYVRALFSSISCLSQMQRSTRRVWRTLLTKIRFLEFSPKWELLKVTSQRVTIPNIRSLVVSIQLILKASRSLATNSSRFRNDWPLSYLKWARLTRAWASAQSIWGKSISWVSALNSPTCILISKSASLIGLTPSRMNRSSRTKSWETSTSTSRRRSNLWMTLLSLRRSTRLSLSEERQPSSQRRRSCSSRRILASGNFQLRTLTEQLSSLMTRRSHTPRCYRRRQRRWKLQRRIT